MIFEISGFLIHSVLKTRCTIAQYTVMPFSIRIHLPACLSIKCCNLEYKNYVDIISDDAELLVATEASLAEA